MAFQDLIDLPHHLAPTRDIEWIVARFADGADFADMTHLVMSPGARSFATFDRRIVIDAGATTPVPIEMLA